MDNHPMATVNSRINSLENTDRKTMILRWSCFVKVPSVTIDITAPFVARLFCFCDIYIPVQKLAFGLRARRPWHAMVAFQSSSLEHELYTVP